MVPYIAFGLKCSPFVFKRGPTLDELCEELLEELLEE
jgi:hypothetical protein